MNIPSVKEFLGISLYNNTLWDYVMSMALLLVTIMGLYLFKLFVTKKLKKISDRTKNTFDDLLVKIIDEIKPIFLFFMAFYVSLKFITINEKIQPVLDSVIVLVLTFWVVQSLQQILVFGVNKMYDRSRAKELPKKGITNILKGVLWGGAGAFVLDNLGFDITALIAGLGITGIAVALAAQSFLGDAFSALFIMIDKPFRVGDFIIVGDYLGTIESIGIKTTRIRSLFGEQLIFSNSDLTSSRIKNYKRMETRRVVFELGVIYQTPREKLKKIPQIIKNIVNSVEKAKFDRSHFHAYGSFSLNFESVYYVLGSDYNLYMDIQQDINFRIHEAFEKEGIEFAYPTQTVYMAKEIQAPTLGS